MGDLKLSKELKEKFVRFRSGRVRDRVQFLTLALYKFIKFIN